MNQTIIKPGAVQARINLPPKQRGVTLLSWIIIIMFILFQAIMAMNVLPAYMTDSTVKTIIEKLPEDQAVKNKTAKEVRAIILKRFRINSIYGLEGKNVVKVKKGRDGVIVKVKYEPRGTLIGNLEYIISFEHEAIISSR